MSLSSIVNKKYQLLHYTENELNARNLINNILIYLTIYSFELKISVIRITFLHFITIIFSLEIFTFNIEIK